MTTDDLARYTAPVRTPTKVTYRGYGVYSMGPPSSGGSTVGEVLEHPRGVLPGGNSTEQILHRSLEAPRYAFADRNAYLADPAFFDVPLKGLLSTLRGRAARLITDRAADEPGGARRPARQRRPRGLGDRLAPNQSTTHLTVADRKGNVVSYTFTIESTGGNAVVVPGYGFLLNNELTDFNYDSTTHPNRAEGRKRPRSSIVADDRHQGRQAVPRARLAGRLDDHRQGGRDPREADRPPQHDARARSPLRGRSSATRRRAGRARVRRLAGGPGARRRARAQVRTARQPPARSAPRPGSSSRARG